MSIYNGSKPRARTSTPPQQTDTKKILNNKDLTALVKLINGGPKTAKEILYDSEKNIIGVLQRNDTPFFLTQSQIKELQAHQEG